MGEPDDVGYYLETDNHKLIINMSVEQIASSIVDISPLVARLLEGDNEIKVGVAESRGA